MHTRLVLKVSLVDRIGSYYSLLLQLVHGHGHVSPPYMHERITVMTCNNYWYQAFAITFSPQL